MSKNVIGKLSAHSLSVHVSPSFWKLTCIKPGFKPDLQSNMIEIYPWEHGLCFNPGPRGLNLKEATLATGQLQRLFWSTVISV